MWSYYGSKANVVDFYPKPFHDTIIEPFAGSARYALKYFEKDVLLIDKYERIIKIWKWLQKCSPGDIRRLPHYFKPNQPLIDFTYDCQEARDLIGFLIGFGMERPRLTASAKRMLVRPNHVNFSLNRIEANLHKIKHWKIEYGDYTEAPAVRATWFIDPPYQHGGKYYTIGKIDYEKLAPWCKEREGQVMVCENTKATWLPFHRMVSHKSTKGMANEAIWTNFPTNYHTVQTLF